MMLLKWLLGGYMPFYRIDEYKVTQRGKRGAIVAVPNTVLRDLGVTQGEKISVYRGVTGGLPVAVLANADTPELAASEAV
jgi:hypothetical protein